MLEKITLKQDTSIVSYYSITVLKQTKNKKALDWPEAYSWWFLHLFPGKIQSHIPFYM